MHYLICALLLVALNKNIAVRGVAIRNDGLYRLDIIHYNDFHARFEETSVDYPVCRTNDSACLGGFPRLYAEVTALFREKPQALLLNAGDSFQGTYWYTLLRWNVTQRFMNMLPHDAHAIGNHEFDDGPSDLAKYLTHLKAPVVSANINSSGEPELWNLYEPHIVVQRANRNIGIIGVTTIETALSSYPGKVRLMSPAKAAQREAAKLTGKGVDLIVLLSHCGVDVDRKIAEDYAENIDIIVGGHSHSLFWNENVSPTREKIEAPYPIIVESNTRKGHKVLIVQASAHTKYMGNLSVWFDSKGEYRSWEGGPIVLNRSIPEDEDMKRLLAPTAAQLHAIVDEVVGQALEPLDHAICHIAECAIGAHVTHALLERAKEQYPSNFSYIAFVQSGGIRDSLPKGPISRGEVMNALPFGDRVKTFTLQGRYILEALEHGAAGKRFMQVAGMRVTYNMTNAPKHRVISVSVENNPGLKSLDNKSFYQVTSFGYIARGRSGYNMVSENLHNIFDLGEEADVFEKYIYAHSPLKAEFEERITVLS